MNAVKAIASALSRHYVLIISSLLFFPSNSALRLGTLGFHSFRSFLRYFANRRASSLINIAIIRLLICLILATSTVRSKRIFKPSARLSASNSYNVKVFSHLEVHHGFFGRKNMRKHLIPRGVLIHTYSYLAKGKRLLFLLTPSSTSQ